MHSVLAYFSLFLAKWRLRMVCKPYMWHVHWDIFLFHGELEFTHSAVWFLIGQYHSLKTFKSVTRWIGSSHICGSGPMGCSVLPGVRVLVKASPPPPLQHLRIQTQPWSLSLSLPGSCLWFPAKGVPIDMRLFPCGIFTICLLLSGEKA